jgi:hypothetical protein
MYKHILENAGDISSMALIPLVLFFLVFAGALIMVFMKNTRDLERMSRLPFEDSLREQLENEIKS